MLHLKDELEANLYEIIAIYPEEIQQILNEFDEIVLKKSHDIGNCLTIKHTIRLTTDILVVGKMEYYTSKEQMDKIVSKNNAQKWSN